jgi:PiT family inorganic phosphate transporter
MDSTFLFIAAIILVALVFDYINGFHDAANSIATVVATRVLSPLQAVAWAAFFNFVAAFTIDFTSLRLVVAETKVASTIGQGMIDVSVVTPHVVLAGLIGAISWNLITWWWKLPSSSSHALIGGYAGAAIAFAGWKAILASGWTKTLIAIAVAPMLGLLLASVLMTSVFWIFRQANPNQMDAWFRRLQLLSAAVFSYSHGANDAQKTMGIISGLLVVGGYLPSFHVPIWVVLAAHAAIGLGTLSGGWRIVGTMGMRLTRLKPRGGFCAETAAAISILTPTALGIPVSTTHVISGAIAGVGSIQRVRAVRWGLARNILWAWVMTIPASAAVGAISMMLIRMI